MYDYGRNTPRWFLSWWRLKIQNPEHFVYCGAVTFNMFLSFGVRPFLQFAEGGTRLRRCSAIFLVSSLSNQIGCLK